MFTTEIKNFNLSQTAVKNIDKIINNHNEDKRNDTRRFIFNKGDEMRPIISMYKQSADLFQVMSATGFIVDMFECLEAYILGRSSGTYEKHYENKQLEEMLMEGDRELDQGPTRVTINTDDVSDKMFSFKLLVKYLGEMERDVHWLERIMEIPKE